MIVDFHAHVFSPDIVNKREKYINRDLLFNVLYTVLKDKQATTDSLIATMNEQNINISVIQNIGWNSSELCREANDYIMESVSRYPDRLIGFCMVNLDSPETAIPELERCIKGGIKGVGEISPMRKTFNNITKLIPVIRKIIDSNLILLTHSSQPVRRLYQGETDISPEVLFTLISTFPDLKLVCSHWGGGLPFYALMPEVKTSLKNVYFDSAASPLLYNNQIYQQVIELVGDEKILFGTDYPTISPKKILTDIESLNFSLNTKNRILFENAVRLLGIRN
jgi:uncharacterized protein